MAEVGAIAEYPAFSSYTAQPATRLRGYTVNSS